ncbi:putative HAT dimerization domain, ribonuclease H-like superfamily, hAT-like transposase, RNase-H [Helianthus annuus]|nr:putative HAT dimerization domain, ribonuclease H-like superfamily, hAT-like transposase, RNase-H [Helianthus annuus]
MKVGAVMDPRYKMELVDLAFKTIYSEEKAKVENTLVQTNLEDLFKEYVEAFKEQVVEDMGSPRNVNVGNGPSGSGSGSRFMSSRFGNGIKTGSAKFAQHIRTADCAESVKLELTTYLEEGVYISEPGVYFDALGWWKANKLKYRILSKMADEVLAIPVTTIASESAFSASGRVIDPHRSCLGTKTVDMLICGADGYRHYYGLEKKKAKENDDVVRVELT